MCYIQGASSVAIIFETCKIPLFFDVLKYVDSYSDLFDASFQFILCSESTNKNTTCSMMMVSFDSKSSRAMEHISH